MTENKTKLRCLYLCLLILIVGCSPSESPKDVERSESRLVIEHYENGDLNMIGHTIDNKKEGEWRLFRRQRLFSVQNYHEGVQHGKEVSYDWCTGKVLEEGQYEMGEPVGLWYFYDDGELVAIREYNDGESTIVYHNSKFKNASEMPPPPPKNYDCYQSDEY